MGDRLLIVEDDDRIGAKLPLGLEDEGYQVTKAASGEPAVDQIRRDPPDMAIVDLTLGTLIDGSLKDAALTAADYAALVAK